MNPLAESCLELIRSPAPGDSGLRAMGDPEDDEEEEAPEKKPEEDEEEEENDGEEQEVPWQVRRSGLTPPGADNKMTVLLQESTAFSPSP